MKQVLVLGSTGFSGRYFEKFVRECKLNKDYTFTGIDKNIKNALESEVFSHLSLNS